MQPTAIVGSAIISSVLNLVARLEQDRQETQNLLQEQETKSVELLLELERRDEERLDLLLECVQAGE